MSILDRGAEMALDRLFPALTAEQVKSIPEPEQFTPSPPMGNLPQGQTPIGTLPRPPMFVDVTLPDGRTVKASVDGNNLYYMGQIIGQYDPTTGQANVTQQPSGVPSPIEQKTPSTLSREAEPWYHPGGQALATILGPKYGLEWQGGKVTGATPETEQAVLELGQKYADKPVNPLTIAQALWDIQSLYKQGGAMRKQYEEKIPLGARIAGETAIDIPYFMGIGKALGAIPKLAQLPKPARAVLGIEKPRPSQEAMNKFLPTAKALLGKAKPKAIVPATPAAAQVVDEQNLVKKFINNIKPMTNLAKGVKEERGLDFAQRLKNAEGLRKQWLASHPGDEWGADLAARKALSGKYTWGEISLEGFDENAIKKLYSIGRQKLQSVWEAGGKLRRGATPDVRAMDLQRGFQRIFYDKKPPTLSQLKAFREAYGAEFAESILKATKDPKWGTFADIMNLPRALLASGDMSAPFRQGVVLSFRDPKNFFRAMKSQFRVALGGDKALKQLDDVIRDRPNFEAGQHYGLKQFDLPGTIGAKYRPGRPETFISRLSEKIPFVKWAERNYIGFLNDLRSRHWEKLYPVLNQAKQSEDDLFKLAQFLNDATGWGNLGRATEYAPLLSNIFFSPRLIMSRLNLPKYLVSSSPLIRKEAWKTFISFVGGTVGVLSTAKLLFPNKVSVEMPQVGKAPSSAMGKLKWGNTQYDLWGGFIQYIRLMAQLVKAEKGYVGSGKTRKITREESLYQFAQTKFAPFLGLVWDMLKGQSYGGEEMFPAEGKGWKDILPEQAKNRLMALWVQDMWDALVEDGLITGVVTGAASFFGVGAVSYTPEEEGYKFGGESTPEAPQKKPAYKFGND